MSCDDCILHRWFLSQQGQVNQQDVSAMQAWYHHKRDQGYVLVPASLFPLVSVYFQAHRRVAARD